MRAIRIPGKNGCLVLNYNLACPFEADSDFEEALLFYLHKISNAVEDQLAATEGEIDNVVEAALCRVEAAVSLKLDEVLAELRRIRSDGGG